MPKSTGLAVARVIVKRHCYRTINISHVLRACDARRQFLFVIWGDLLSRPLKCPQHQWRVHGGGGGGGGEIEAVRSYF